VLLLDTFRATAQDCPRAHLAQRRQQLIPVTVDHRPLPWTKGRAAAGAPKCATGWIVAPFVRSAQVLSILRLDGVPVAASRQ
jgi:hypothetical protein